MSETRGGRACADSGVGKSERTTSDGNGIDATAARERPERAPSIIVSVDAPRGRSAGGVTKRMADKVVQASRRSQRLGASPPAPAATATGAAKSRSFTLDRRRAREIADLAVAEALGEWLSQETGRTVRGTELVEDLEDGAVLCVLASRFGQVVRFKDPPANEFQRMQNFEMFKDACARMGLTSAPPPARKGAPLKDFIPCLLEMAQLAAKHGAMMVAPQKLEPPPQSPSQSQAPVLDDEPKGGNVKAPPPLPPVPKLDTVSVAAASGAALALPSPGTPSSTVVAVSTPRGLEEAPTVALATKPSASAAATARGRADDDDANNSEENEGDIDDDDEARDINELLGSLHELRVARQRAKPPKLRFVRTGGRELMVVERPGEAVGSILWDGAAVLVEHLWRHEAARFRDPRARVLELGAGVGLCGVWAACEGSDVVVTDLPACVDLLWANVAANAQQIVKGGGSCSARALDFNDVAAVQKLVAQLGSDGPLTLVASDVVYNETVKPLTAAVAAVFRVRPDATLYLSYKPRDAANERGFFTALEADPGVEFVSVGGSDGGAPSSSKVFMARLKAEKVAV